MQDGVVTIHIFSPLKNTLTQGSEAHMVSLFGNQVGSQTTIVKRGA